MHSSLSVNPKFQIILSPTFPLGNQKFVFYVCESISVLEMSPLFLDSMHKWYDICLSLYDLVHLIW